MLKDNFCLNLQYVLSCNQSILLLSHFIDEPGKPGKPEVVDWDKDHVDLKWEKPINDGGAPISGYIIEKREVGSPKWVKACEVSERISILIYCLEKNNIVPVLYSD